MACQHGLQPHLVASSYSRGRCKVASGNQHGGSGIVIGLFHQAAYGRSGYLVALRNLSQRHSTTAIFDHLFPIYIQPCMPDLPTFQLRPSHARLHALDNQTSFKFSDRAVDQDDCPTQRTIGADSDSHGSAIQESCRLRGQESVSGDYPNGLYSGL